MRGFSPDIPDSSYKETHAVLATGTAHKNPDITSTHAYVWVFRCRTLLALSRLSSTMKNSSYWSTVGGRKGEDVIGICRPGPGLEGKPRRLHDSTSSFLVKHIIAVYVRCPSDRLCFACALTSTHPPITELELPIENMALAPTFGKSYEHRTNGVSHRKRMCHILPF